MKTSTVLDHSLLLVGVLAVYCATGEFVPDQGSERGFTEFFDSHPFTPYPFQDVPFISYNRYPYSPFLGYRGTHHRVVVADPFSVVSFLANNERWLNQDGSDESNGSNKSNDRDESNMSDEDDHGRRKRQATFDLGMQGGPRGNNYHTRAGYTHNFNNDRTSVGVSAQKNWGVGGRSHGVGVGFSHKFGR